MGQDIELLTIEEASHWASEFTGRDITNSNISYLIQYARVRASGSNGITMVNKKDLVRYYSAIKKKESKWKKELGEDLNWDLSFDWVKEKDRTKHVHRLHPYKGKFIPQLVEYFLDSHTDKFKQKAFFEKGDVVLDPFCGSGTTLVQANELGIHAIGIDISEFNSLISNVKVTNFNLFQLNQQITRITHELKGYLKAKHHDDFEKKLSEELSVFNSKSFPTPEYKLKVRREEINETEYSESKEEEFLPIYFNLVEEFGIETTPNISESFIDTWYLPPVRDEIKFVYKLIESIPQEDTRNIIRVILSRVIRSCRATTHSDLATLKEPIVQPYYCTKHYKMCKPLFSILKKWKTYSKDTVNRLLLFRDLRTSTLQHCITGDSRTIDIFHALENDNVELANVIKDKKIKGIFSSPPYVGLIDYHDQHAYAYELFGFKRRDDQEIGPLFKGQGAEARKSYVEGISQVLKNCERFLVDDYDIFLVANDKYKLYPKIAENAGMRIVEEYKRPVLNRTERDKSAYAEIIFHLKRK